MAKRKQKRPRRSFTDEFKADAVRLCKSGDRTIGQVAKDLDLTETALREWVHRAEAVASQTSVDALTGEERDELRELRKRVKRLEMEREILKKAAVRSIRRCNTLLRPRGALHASSPSSSGVLVAAAG
jgi:transposase